MGKRNTKKLATEKKVYGKPLKQLINLIRRLLRMKKSDTFIYYSPATDVTGKALATALGIKGGSKLPAKAPGIVIGWGAKTKDSVNLGKSSVLNHPDRIPDNRNKFKTLQKLAAAKVNVADICTAGDVSSTLKSGKKMQLPLVGRTNYHQGGKGFWLCMTHGQVADATKKGAQYFQNYIGIKDEYRLHIFGDKLIYAVKKVQRSNMNKAFTEQHAEKIKASAEKGKKKIDDDTMAYVLERVGKRVQPDADMIVRSNMRGWKFSHVKSVSKDLEAVAVKALKAVGLEFGAVDCCTDEDGKHWIIEINSGPGLQGTSFDTYVASFNAALDEIIKPPKKEEKKETVTKAEVQTASPAAITPGGKKEELAKKLALFTEMVGHASEEEADALSSVAAKMFR
jgi:glutathione synthase/RimK-type ligase-like ATP-grasp enzyme